MRVVIDDDSKANGSACYCDYQKFPYVSRDRDKLLQYTVFRQVKFVKSLLPNVNKSLPFGITSTSECMSIQSLE